MAYANPGKEIADRVGASTFLLAFVAILTLDACNCSRRFHQCAFTSMFVSLVAAFLSALFLWSDVIIHHGTESGIGTFSKNRFQKTALSGMLGLMAPAMAAAWMDKDHHSCYLLSDILYKADLVVEKKA
jgi:hypothetical protein